MHNQVVTLESVMVIVFQLLSLKQPGNHGVGVQTIACQCNVLTMLSSCIITCDGEKT